MLINNIIDTQRLNNVGNFPALFLFVIGEILFNVAFYNTRYSFSLEYVDILLTLNVIQRTYSCVNVLIFLTLAVDQLNKKFNSTAVL